MGRRFIFREHQRGSLLSSTAPVLITLLVSAALAPSAMAASTPQLPAAAQGHPYRHGVVPTRGHASSQSSAAPSGNLAYGGGTLSVGVVTGPPKVYLVFWGSQWGTQGTDSNGDATFTGDASGMAPYLQEFLKGLGTGSETWSGVMTQYCQGVSLGATSCPASNTQHVGYPTGGALAGVWYDNSGASPSTSTGNQLAQEAVLAAEHFNDWSSSSQYVIVSPTGTNPDNYQTAGFCAWHDYTGDSTLDGGGAAPSPSGDPPVAFTNLPYIPDAGAGCGQGFVNTPGTLDGVSIVEGHEYAETATDTFPAGGWTDASGNENGDKCAWITPGTSGGAANLALTTGSFAVQSTWANDGSGGKGACEISHPIVTDPVNTVTVTDPGSQSGTAALPVAPLGMRASDSASGQTLTWSATGLPPGLQIDAATGVISGTPSHVGAYTVTVTATDPTNAAGSTQFLWSIAALATSTSVSCTPNSVYVGSAAACTATVSDTASGATNPPSGSVNFTASPTGQGAFSGGGTCSLAPNGTPGAASCEISYTPTTAGSPTVSASYGGGDGVHSGSSNQTALVASSPPPPPPVSPPTTTPSTPLPASSPPAAHPAFACPAPSGSLAGSTLGLIKLGMAPSQVIAAYGANHVHPSGSEDTICLTSGTITVGFGSSKLLAGLSHGARHRLAGHVVWATTTSSFFSIDGIHVGMKLAAARRALSPAKHSLVHHVAWYLLSGPGATAVVKVRGGIVREVGIATSALVRTARVLVRALA